MTVYETTLGDQNSVYITAHAPNQSAYPSIPGQAFDLNPIGNAASVSAHVDRKAAQVVAFTGRINIVSEDAKACLKNQAAVKTFQISSCEIDIVVASIHSFRLTFPAPVLCSKTKTRIARKSSYIEVVVPIASFSMEPSFPHFMYPLFLQDHTPVLWNMPHLDLERLPVIDSTKKADLQWIGSHVGLQFSSREKGLGNQSDFEKPQDVRVDFKASLNSMFMRYTGVKNTEQASIFEINNPTDGGVHILVFVPCLRLDLANHTVILDAAILPLTDVLVPQIAPFLAALSRIRTCFIKVNTEELILWRKLLPAWVERCREWKHTSSCEYKLKDTIPLTLERGQMPICSCGNGVLPKNYMVGVPRWNMVSNHVVRAAISPSFSVPYVEPTVDKADLEKLEALAETTCAKCGEKKTKEGRALLRCSKCLAVKYYSKECQQADWKRHKKVCDK